MKFTDVPVSVEARFEPDGSITPLAFTWQGRRVAIATVGRRWTADDGTRRFLVMSPLDEVFELSFDPTASAWKVVRTWERPKMA